MGAVAADTALALLSGRDVGQVQPVEVHLVMTDRSLLGTGDPSRSVMEPARIPGHGPVPAPVARAWLRHGLDGPRGGQDGTGDARAGRVWLRRLYTCPQGRDLVAMDSRRRVFTGLLRRMLVLRDDVCTTPWCESAVVHADHAVPVRQGGVTDVVTGNGKCARCNYVKEAPGWQVTVLASGIPAIPSIPGLPGTHGPRGTQAATAGRRSRAVAVPRVGSAEALRELQVTTPTGHAYRSVPPPLTGWGWQPSPTARRSRSHQTPPTRAASSTRRPADRPPKRPRLRSRLERHHVLLLAAGSQARGP